MTSSAITPLCSLTIRAHTISNNAIIASYAYCIGEHFHTGSKILQETEAKGLIKAKIEILSQALTALGEGKRLNIEIDDKEILRFLKTGILEKYGDRYQNIVDNLSMQLSLCSSVTCQSWVDYNLFNAALEEYRRAKADFIKPMPSYQELFAAHKRLIEARKQEAAVLNW